MVSTRSRGAAAPRKRGRGENGQEPGKSRRRATDKQEKEVKKKAKVAVEEEASEDASSAMSGSDDESGGIQEERVAKAPTGLSRFEDNSQQENQADDDDDDKEEEEEEGSLSSEDDADIEEAELEKAVFGNLSSTKLKSNVESALKNKPKGGSSVSNADGLFFEDTERGDSEADSDGNGSEASQDDSRAAAWVDEDDSKVAVDLANTARLRKLRNSRKERMVDGSSYAARLRDQHAKLSSATPSWAKVKARGEKVPDSDGEQDEEELFQSSKAYTKSRSGSHLLPPGRLHVSRLIDANQQSPSKAVVQSVDWHKNGQLLATAGMDKTLRIFQIDGKSNHKMESVYLKDMPIWDARFAGVHHEQIICVGRRRFFYWMDLQSGAVSKVPRLLGRNEKSLESMAVAPDGSSIAFCGYDGNLLFVSQQTKQFMHSLKMNENATRATFSDNGLELYSSGDKGGVYCWDMRMRRLRFRFRDQGSIATRSLALSKGSRFIALGSTNGVVNLYDLGAVQEAAAQGNFNPEPTKAILNLTTPVDQVLFNHDSQLLAMQSRRKKDALRLFNVNTMSVVPNWPTSSTPIHYGSCVSFSPSSDSIVVGNDRGRCLLYRLHHYSYGGIN